MNKVGEFLNPFSGEYMGPVAHFARVGEMWALVGVVAALGGECAYTIAGIFAIVAGIATIKQSAVAPDYSVAKKPGKFSIRR